MGLHFHPLVGPVDFSDLFLTCSVDWTVKLWRAKSLTNTSGPPPPSLPTNLSSSTSGKSAGATGSHASAITPIYSFEEADDYVYDVKWHPLHPAMFGTADGSGKFDLWNLNTDTEVTQFALRLSLGTDWVFRSPSYLLPSAPAGPSTRCNGTRKTVDVSPLEGATANYIFTISETWVYRGTRSGRIRRGLSLGSLGLVRADMAMETVALGLRLVGESVYGLFFTCCLYLYMTVTVDNGRLRVQKRGG